MNVPRRGVLLCVAEQEIYRKLKHDILARPQPIKIHRVSGLSQLGAKLPRMSPIAIVLDESSAPLTTSPGELRKVSQQAPLIFIGSAAAGPLLAPLVADGHADFVNRQCGFALLAAALIERRVHTANVLDIYGPSARSVFQSAFSIALAGASPGGFPKELVATLRHEINNPLTGILGNAELLLRSADRSSLISTKRLEIIVELAVRLREEGLGIT